MSGIVLWLLGTVLLREASRPCVCGRPDTDPCEPEWGWLEALGWPWVALLVAWGNVRNWKEL